MSVSKEIISARISDMLVYLVAQGPNLSLDNWTDAVEDMFPEYPRSDQQRLILAGKALLANTVVDAGLIGGPGGTD